MLWAPALLLAFLTPSSQTAFNLEWSGKSFTKQTGKFATIPCDIVKENIDYVHWYQHQEGEVPKRILYYSFLSSKFSVDSGISQGKYHASESTGRSCKFVVRNLEKSDSGVYYCAAWDVASSGVIKIFGQGTKLTVIPSGGHRSPKPTMFLPSIAETHFHKAGTYLCLLEDFVPDVIKVYWKAKDGNTILESHQGNTVKTKDAYMKVSWLTVKGKSMDEEHKCVVRHENTKGGVDQEILFPSINKGVFPTVPTEATYLLTTGNTPSPPPECSSAELNAGRLDVEELGLSEFLLCTSQL